MILCLDIGNTFIKCAVVGVDRVLGREAVETARFRDTTLLNNLVERVSSAVATIDYVAMTSVVPEITPAIAEVVKRRVGLKPHVVDHTMRLPFKLEVPTPSLVGTDRIGSADLWVAG